MTISCCVCEVEISPGQMGYFRENGFGAILFFCSKTCYDKEAAEK